MLARPVPDPLLLLLRLPFFLFFFCNRYDAFSGKATSQYSLAYEKASVIYNTAATLSAIAASQNRAEPDGRKRAFNFFQAAAGMFQYINDNFLHAPSQDLHRDTVKMLTDLMLAQAHECFIENSLREKKKDSLIAKLASHAAWAYAGLVDALHDANQRGVGVDKAWTTTCQIKQKYYHAAAQQHRAAVCQAESAYGEQVSRLALGEATAKEAVKLASSGNYMSSLVQLGGGAPSSPDAMAGVPPDCLSALQELCKAQQAALAEAHSMAARDNDMIYHDHVPKDSILTPIDRLKAVSPVPISELYGPNEVNKVIGGDIFARLIPLSVHESASLYSEEKAKMMRAEAERCDLAKAELKASLDYMKLPSSLNKFKQGKGASEEALLDSLAQPTRETRTWAEQVASDEASTGVRDLTDTLEALKTRAREMLNKVGLALDQENRECETMRVKYGDDWTQEPSGMSTAGFRQDLRNHRETLDQAAQSDGQLLRQLDTIHKDIATMRNPQALETLFAEALTSPQQTEKAASETTLLDLDIDVGMGNKSMDVKVSKVEAILEKLDKIEKDRNATLEDLKEKVYEKV